MRSGLLAFASMLAIAACNGDIPDRTEERPAVNGDTIVYEADRAPRIATTPVTVDAPPPVRLNGVLTWDEDRTVRIHSPFAGRVVRIQARVGDTVRQGQVLAVLASPEFGQAQAEARKAEADLTLAESNLERIAELERHGVAPRKDLQAAQTEQARARAELERTRARVKLYGWAGSGVDQTYALTSPIAGVVVERNLNPGQEIRPDQMTSSGQAPFVVSDPAHLWASLDAGEQDLQHISVGTRVGLRTPVYRDADFSARIIAISDFIDPATRTLKVRATVDNSHKRLKAEMFITGEIQTRVEPMVQVPATAVFFLAGTHYVFTHEGVGRYTRREVRTGVEHQGRVTIETGLSQGQSVVTEGVLMLQQVLQPRRVQK